MEQLLSNKYEQLCDTLLIVEEFIGELASARTQMDIAVKICPYVDNLKKLVKENPSAVVETIAHDYIGLRDEEDEEIKQYTHDKNILEIVVEKENHINEMENKIYKIMALALAFLKQVKLVPHSMQPKYLNKMNIL